MRGTRGVGAGPGDRVLGHVAVAAVQLHARRRRPGRAARSSTTWPWRRRPASARPALSSSDAAVDERLGDVDLGRRARRARSGWPAARRAAAERRALAHVVDGQLEGRLRAGDRGRRRARAAPAARLRVRPKKPVALLAEQVRRPGRARRRRTARRCPARACPSLSSLRPRSKPGVSALDDEQAEARGAGRRRCAPR